MKEIIIKSYAFNLKYAERLVEDITEELMTKVPAKGFENHASFTLGHLISASALTSKYLDGPYEMKPSWEKLFKRKGPGDPTLPDADSELYPGKEELLTVLKKQHNIVENIIEDLGEIKFSEQCNWRFKTHFPTLGDLLFFMCITHESMHLGQLAGWRRALGYSSALEKL